MPALFRLYALLAIFLVGCRPDAHAKRLDGTGVTIPEYPTLGDNVYALGSNLSQMEYGGTLLVLRDDASTESMQRVLSASSKARESWANLAVWEKQVKFRQLYKPEVGLYDRYLTQLQNQSTAIDQQAREDSRNHIPYDQKLTASTQWLNQALEQSYGATASPEKTAAAAIVGAYCEAKIWEMATQSLFLQTNWSQRPEPLAMCHDYYESHQFFATATPDALCGTTGSPKNYAHCLWTEGVMKTRWWQSPDYFTDAQKTQMQALWGTPEAAEATRKVLALDPSAFPDNILVKRKILGKSHQYFSTYILGLTGLAAAEKTACPTYIIDVPTQMLCQLFAADFSKARATLQTVRSGQPDTVALTQAILDTLSPAEIIRQVQQGNGELRFAARNGQPDLHQAFRILAMRDNHKLSIVDAVTFPAPLFTADNITTLTSAADFQLLSQLQQEMGNVFGIPSAEDQQRIDQLQSEAQKIATEQRAMRAKSDAFLAQADRAANEGFAAAHQPGLGYAFWEIRLTIRRMGNVVLAKLENKNDDRVGVVGCFSWEDQQSMREGCDWPNPQAQQLLTADQFHIDANTGKITFTVTMQDPDALGFGYAERKLQNGKYLPYNDLTADQLRGQTLRLELFTNKMQSTLDILTGKAFITNSDGQRLYEGGVSMWDQDRHYE